MSTTTTPSTGTAPIQGALWGARADDWAEIQEPQSLPLFRRTIELAGIGDGTNLLDAGCASGILLELARSGGATVTGVDAAAPLLEIGPLVLFFVANGKWDIFVGTTVFVVATANDIHTAISLRLSRSGATGMNAPNAVATPVTQPSRIGVLVASPILSSSRTFSSSAFSGSAMTAVANSLA